MSESLPGLIAATPRDRDYYRRAVAEGRAVTSTVLYALEELRSGYGDKFYRAFPGLVRRLLAEKLERREQEESERASRRSRDQIRRAAVSAGDAEPLSIFNDGYSNLGVPGDKRERRALTKAAA